MIDQIDELMLRHILLHPGCSYRQLRKVTGLAISPIKARVDKLAGHGYIKHPRGRHGTLVIKNESARIDSAGKLWCKRLDLDYNDGP